MHLSDYVVYQSEFVKRCADKYLGKFSGPSSVIINPVDTAHFKPREVPLPQEELIIIMLGNHHESKERLEISLEAVRNIRAKGINARLIIIGRTDNTINEEWIDRRGAYLQSDAPAIFQSAHIFLHLKYLDPCPITVLEAQACGLPVVGQANGGMPELVSEQSGILLPVIEDFDHLHYPEAESVSDAILQIKDNLEEFSKNAREQSLKFDKEIWLDKHEIIFKSLIQ
jgi:glycosyltransferase involved in cell wall biosynthesis